jgi:hypothetical protein
MSPELTVMPATLVTQQPPTFTLLQQALQLKLPVADVQAWMDLYEREQAKLAVQQFAAALSAAQAEMPCIVKDAENTHTRSRYARLETIVHDIKPVYTSKGLSLSFEQEPCPLEGHIRVRADLRHEAGHIQQYRVDMPKDGLGSKGGVIAMNALQAVGSTMAYCRRYLVCMIFDLVIAGQDLDGNDPGSFITPEQVGQINDLIKLIPDLDFTRFKAWAQVKELDELRVAQFPMVMTELRRRAKQNGGKP